MTQAQEDRAIVADEGLLEQGNAATLIMSRTGIGKSSLIATLARFVKREYDKVLLLNMYDGGGFPMEVQVLVLAGVIRLFRARTRDPYNRGLMWDTVIKSAQGWWPTQINPRTGEVPPGVAMMPPIITEYQIRCPNGHLFIQTTNQQDIRAGMCRECQAMTNEMTWQVSSVASRPPFYRDVGAVAFDSLTQMLNWGEEDLSNRQGRGDIAGLEGAIGGKIISGDQKLGQTTMSHIGFAQQQARSLVLMTNGIPGLVVPPVFTALTLEGTLEGSRICGPELSGKKKTPTAGAWFGNVLEPEKKEVGKDGQGRPTYQYLLHLEQWIDDDGVIHLCKNRATPGLLPPIYKDPVLTNTPKDQETAFTEFSLGKFFTDLEGALAQKTKTTLAEYGTTLVPNEVITHDVPKSVVAMPAPVAGGPIGIPGVAVASGPAPFATLGGAPAGVGLPFQPAGFAAIGGPAAPPALPTLAPPAGPAGAPFVPPVTTAPASSGPVPTIAPPAGRMAPPAGPTAAPAAAAPAPVPAPVPVPGPASAPPRAAPLPGPPPARPPAAPAPPPPFTVVAPAALSPPASPIKTTL